MKNLIGNEWLEASNGEKIDVTNPATNEFIASVPNSTEKEVDKAVKYEEEEQKNWAETPMY